MKNNKLDLNGHSDAEIVEALIRLPANKFLSVTIGLGEVHKRIERRGKSIADKYTNDQMDDMLRRLFNGDSVDE